LLTNLLLPLIKQSAPARIVNVSSDAHKGATIHFDDLQSQHRYSGWRAYQQSKLANVLFTYELARRLEGTWVPVNTLHPGFVRIDLFTGWAGWTGWLVRRSAHLVAVTPEQGARTSIYLSSAPEVRGVTGRYFVKQQPAPSSAASHDQAVAQRLWQVSQELT